MLKWEEWDSPTIGSNSIGGSGGRNVGCNEERGDI